MNTFKTDLKDIRKTDTTVHSSANLAPLFVRRKLWCYRGWPGLFRWPLDCWDYAFEYRWGPGVCVFRGLCVVREVSETGRSLVWKSPADCGVSECDGGKLTIRRAWPTRGCRAMKKKYRVSKGESICGITGGFCSHGRQVRMVLYRIFDCVLLSNSLGCCMEH